MGCVNRCLSLKLLFFFSSFHLLVCPQAALAQIPTQTGGGASGQIVVHVREANGSPMGQQARVTLRSPSQLTNATTGTADGGKAQFTGLPAGQYVVEVSAPGYRTVEQEAVIAADGRQRIWT